jgi:hypothetical protein
MSLGNFEGAVWLHFGARPPAHAPLVAGLTDGVVLQTPGASETWQALRVEHPFILQHNGKSAVPTLWGEEYDWLLRQAGAEVLTNPVRYVPLGDADGLRHAVTAVADFAGIAAKEDPSRPVMGLFAVSANWLKVQADRSVLADALRSVEAPVGLMLGGNPRDPLDDQRIVDGLVKVIHAVPHFSLLRSDHGALGAIAFGAAAASVGLTTGARHFVGPDEYGRRDLDDPTPRVFIEPLLAWWKGSKIALIDGDPLLTCDCGVCAGGSLARFQDEALEPEADRHSVTAWSTMAQHLLQLPKAGQEDEWLHICRTAYANLAALEDRVGSPQPAPRQLKAWLGAAGIVAV